MVKIDFECPLCNEKNILVLMGDDNGEFNKKCKACKAPLEVSNKANKIEVKARFPKEIVRNTVKENKIPSDYKIYNFEKENRKVATFIAMLILISSLLGFVTGLRLISSFDSDYSESDEINLEIVVKNNTMNLENVTIMFNDIEMNYTYQEKGIYKVLAKPGIYSITVLASEHKNATMEIFVPPQENNLRLPASDEGIPGTNKFIFMMEEGSGNINLGKNIYSQIYSWCPNLIFLFSLIGLWGSWVTYKLQSFHHAQIGAFFSVLALGGGFIGPILGIIALYYLKKNKTIFTASFKN